MSILVGTDTKLAEYDFPPLKGAITIEFSLSPLGSEAIVRNRPVSFAIDLGTRRFQIGSGPVRQLPRELTITLVTVAGNGR